jgi:uncharacterized protein DUF3579
MPESAAAARLCGVMAAYGGDHRMQYSPFVHPITVNGVRCVVVDRRLEQIEERTRLAELQRVGDTA